MVSAEKKMEGSIFVIDTRDENIEQQGVQIGNCWTTEKLSARKLLDDRFIFQN